MVRQMQQLFYGKRYEINLPAEKERAVRTNCKGPNPACPPYEPDFVKLCGELRGVRNPCNERG